MKLKTATKPQPKVGALSENTEKDIYGKKELVVFMISSVNSVAKWFLFYE